MSGCGLRESRAYPQAGTGTGVLTFSGAGRRVCGNCLSGIAFLAWDDDGADASDIFNAKYDICTCSKDSLG
jgi:hypothetical protein